MSETSYKEVYIEPHDRVTSVNWGNWHLPFVEDATIAQNCQNIAEIVFQEIWGSLTANVTSDNGIASVAVGSADLDLWASFDLKKLLSGSLKSCMEDYYINPQGVMDPEGVVALTEINRALAEAYAYTSALLDQQNKTNTEQET